MLTPSEAIELLMAAGVERVERSPAIPRITLADTIEAKAAELIAFYERRSIEIGLTQDRLADALDAFWNAAIGAAHERQTTAAMDCASVMAQGLAAVSQKLREGSTR